MNPILIFHCELKESSQLLSGKLVWFDKETNVVTDEFLAASGCPGYQLPANISAKGRGPIPPPIKCGINNYWVMTKPIYMPDIKGIQGNFYQIFPHEVIVNGVNRGDFGIHADRNVPGSSGCVVLITEVGWVALQKWMAAAFAEGIDRVPMQISYSNK